MSNSETRTTAISLDGDHVESAWSVPQCEAAEVGGGSPGQGGLLPVVDRAQSAAKPTP